MSLDRFNILNSSKIPWRYPWAAPSTRTRIRYTIWEAMGNTSLRPLRVSRNSTTKTSWSGPNSYLIERKKKSLLSLCLVHYILIWLFRLRAQVLFRFRFHTLAQTFASSPLPSQHNPSSVFAIHTRDTPFLYSYPSPICAFIPVETSPKVSVFVLSVFLS